MAVLSARNIPKEAVSSLEDAAWPEKAVVLQVRAGKIKQAALGGEIASAIYKKEKNGPVLCSPTGLTGDEHASWRHGGTERAIHQYNPDHYPDWQAENTPNPQLFAAGAFGENLIATSMTEENVCIGDVFQLGVDILLEVSEPRHPCHKLIARFQWERALNRTIRTGRSGWNFRVLHTGLVRKGGFLDVGQTTVSPMLPLTDMFKDLANARLRQAAKVYTLVDAEFVTPRVRRLTFELKQSLTLTNPQFDPYAFAQITFGPGAAFSRSYSIVDGDLYRFTLGVALDRQSRGGSAYIHHELKVGDTIQMAPGSNPGAQENDKKCDPATKRIVIVGGIGVTGFLPSICSWEAKNLPYHVHYAVRSADEAAFLDRIPAEKTTVYASSRGERLDMAKIIPTLGPEGAPQVRIFSCGPSRMVQEAGRIAAALGYPEHMVHLEDFGSGDGGDLGDEFEVEVDQPDTNRHEQLTVPRNRTLLDVLNDAGFDVVFSCKSGACGACKVRVCEGDIDYKSSALLSKDKGAALQSCVDRGLGKLKIEVD
ncbi:MOSC domain-containing protein [Apiospora aurea]|uniref:MOSC domain-containing protein n=1 Tax=Apiospora aurea TaxID=335848 RepID=A0ABR1Q5L0_9PEZI